MRLGQNYFVTCGTCGMLGHGREACPLKSHYHGQAQRQIARGSQDPDILREVYGDRAERIQAKEQLPR
jgi:hypothetical protein